VSVTDEHHAWYSSDVILSVAKDLWICVGDY
jgi:hypothetical protein